MKRILSIIVIVVLTIFLGIVIYNFACGMKMTKSDNQVIENDKNIDFIIVSSDYKSLKYRIVNNSDFDAIYDAYFEIEKNVNGVWQKYEVALDFIEVIYTLKSGESAEEDVVYSNIYSLGKGKYRLIKYVNSKIVSAEFELN